MISVERAVTKLLGDDVVAIPTETVYGLAGRIDSDAALKKIFAVKQRPFFDPLIVHVLDFSNTKDLVQTWPPVLADLAQTFWPGPLTLVLPKSTHIRDLITSGLPTVAIRSPRHPVARDILKSTGPLAAPSANRFGRTSPTTAAHVISEFDNIDVVDGGPCEVGLESTVVALSPSGESLQILRPGRILAADLRPFADKYKLRLETANAQQSPGHLPHHYQPEVPLVLLRSSLNKESLQDALAAEFGRREFDLQFLQLPSEPHEAARLLYSEFRKLSQNPKHIIIADPSQWRWTSDASDLMDRLTRAASIVF